MNWALVAQQAGTGPVVVRNGSLGSIRYDLNSLKTLFCHNWLNCDGYMRSDDELVVPALARIYWIEQVSQ